MEYSYKAVCEFWHGKQVPIDRFNKEILINKDLVKEMIKEMIDLDAGDGDQFLIINGKK
jgi:hypothetical protein